MPQEHKPASVVKSGESLCSVPSKTFLRAVAIAIALFLFLLAPSGSLPTQAQTGDSYVYLPAVYRPGLRVLPTWTQYTQNSTTHFVGEVVNESTQVLNKSFVWVHLWAGDFDTGFGAHRETNRAVLAPRETTCFNIDTTDPLPAIETQAQFWFTYDLPDGYSYTHNFRFTDGAVNDRSQGLRGYQGKITNLNPVPVYDVVISVMVRSAQGEVLDCVKKLADSTLFELNPGETKTYSINLDRVDLPLSSQYYFPQAEALLP